MKKLAFCAALIALPLAMTSHVAAAKPAKKQQSKTQVNWQPSYWAAQKEARRSGKPLFIDFYTDWCGPCKYLDETTYRDWPLGGARTTKSCCEYLNRRGGGPVDHHGLWKCSHFLGDRDYGVQTHLQSLTLLHHAAKWDRLNVVNSVAV